MTKRAILLGATLLLGACGGPLTGDRPAADTEGGVPDAGDATDAAVAIDAGDVTDAGAATDAGTDAG